jgi:hypothetical protein
LPKAASDLKGTLWTFRKRSADLDHAEQERLDRLLADSPALETAYTGHILDTTRSDAVSGLDAFLNNG